MANNPQYLSTIPPLTYGYPVPPAFIPPNMSMAMPDINSAPPSSETTWSEHTAQDGRIYYHNNFTKQSTWDKPDELKTPAEKVLSQCPWKEFHSEQNKTYYYNSETKLSVWVKPQELIDAEEKAKELETGDVKSEETEVKKETSNDTTEVSAIDEAIRLTLGAIESGLVVVPGMKKDEEQKKMSAIPVPEKRMYNTKEEMEEGWKQILREFNVPGNSNWETAVKMISSDPRYQELKKYNQKKQIFNNYKTQRQKEEREEARLKIKKAKEDLEQFLAHHPNLSTEVSYRKADQLLVNCPEWTAVPERDRRDIYEDALALMSKREKEKMKQLRKRNIKFFNEILDEMTNLTYKTTWVEAQKILLLNERFVEDVELQSMDKEDALVCFEEHIHLLEKDYEEEKERERKRIRRQQRKNREAFNVFLDELHDSKKLTSLSMWKDLYSTISKDERFYKMLSQPGSTPLDLFKFYVLNLKSHYPRDKKVVKDIMEEKHFIVGVGTTLSEFLSVLGNDVRLTNCDEGNIRMAYTSLIEKAEAADKAMRKEQMKITKKHEYNFKEMLRNNNIVGSDSWEEVTSKLGGREEFKSVELESDRMRYYKEYILSITDDKMSLDQANNDNKNRKKRKHRSSSTGSSRKHKKKKKRNHRDGDSGDNLKYNSEEEEYKRKSKKSKKKKGKKRKHHRDDSINSIHEEPDNKMEVQHKTITESHNLSQRSNENGLKHASDGELFDDEEIEEGMIVEKKNQNKTVNSNSEGEISEEERY